MSNQDQRCCGSGVCIINEKGQCWCGQIWDGQKMIAPKLVKSESSDKLNQPLRPEK